MTDETLQRFMSGEASPEEAVAVEAWLQGSPEAGATGILAMRSFGESERESRVGNENRWSGISERLGALHTPPASQARTWSYRWNVAWAFPLIAIVAVSYISVLLQSIHSGTTTPVTKTYTTQNGQRAKITLPDGSQAVLGPATSIAVTGRSVKLTGEAMFAVTQQNSEPFTVQSGATVTRVLGTTFVVRYYENDSIARVAVRDGRVSVAKSVLDAGDVANVSTGRVEILHNQPLDAMLAFAKGVLVVKETPLRDALADMERWFDVKIEVSDASLLNKVISGEISGSSVTDLEEILAPTLNARTVRRGRTLTIYPVK